MIARTTKSISSSLTATSIVAPSSPTLDVVIVGGGLSGMYLAHELEMSVTNDNRKWQLLEASPVLGGRLANDDPDVSTTHEKKIDLGGAWIWPTHQPHIRNLIQQLQIPTFPQPDDPTSTRIVGGAVEIVRKLQSNVVSSSPETEKFRTGVAITKCQLVQNDNHDHSSSYVTLETSTGEIITTRTVMFAVPPKILSQKVTFDPPLPHRKQQAMESSQTWMAGVTKVALVYPQRFWSLQMSNMGLPSSSSPRAAPAFQVYDASTQDKSTIALTFFTLASSINDDKLLAHACALQLANVWSRMGLSKTPAMIEDMVASYTTYFVQRWPLKEYISNDTSPTRIHPHPHPIPPLAETAWNNRLFFAGSETDQLSPGVMEGAIGSAKRVIQQYVSSLPSPTR